MNLKLIVYSHTLLSVLLSDYNIWLGEHTSINVQGHCSYCLLKWSARYKLVVSSSTSLLRYALVCDAIAAFCSSCSSSSSESLSIFLFYLFFDGRQLSKNDLCKVRLQTAKISVSTSQQVGLVPALPKAYL